MPQVNAEKELILTPNAVQKKINRIAFEVYESNYGEKKIVVAGVGARGAFIAKALCLKLKEISPLTIDEIYLAKENSPGFEPSPEAEIKSKCLKQTVLLVDDVLYSGRTMFNALAQVMQQGPVKVQMAVLVDRGHRSIPVSPDFVGLELATTLKQHVSVEVDKMGKISAFLQ